MSKALKIVALTALVVGASILTMNPAAGAAIASALGTSVAVGTAIAVTAGGVLMTMGTAGLQRNLAGRPGSGLSDLTRLNLTSVAAASRKMVLGRTAFAADLRYDEPSGTDQRYVDAIIHLASHKSTSVEELRIGDKVAWTAAGGVQGEFVGFLTVQVILEAGPSAYHVVNSGAYWGANQRLTGCTTAKIRIDRQGTKRASSPFAAGLPSQVMFIGRGMPLYDPRRDSTVPGGSGPHRVDDQSTWQYADGAYELGQNLALQALAWRLGWRINGEVSCGKGDPASHLDLIAFAASANACDDAIALAGGGTQRRYQGAAVIPDDADDGVVEQNFADCVGGWWDDSNGKLGLHVAVNDLAGAILDFDEDDILGAVTWDPFPAIAEQVNVVRGLNPDPQLPANYQPTDYPEAGIDSPDGIDRVLPFNLPLIQDKRTAQRLAKQALQRKQYPGLFGATFGVRAWHKGAKKGRVIRLSFGPLGFVSKLFRVMDRTKNADGSIALILREEHPAIYQWDAEESPAVVAADAIRYNALNNPFLITSGTQIGVEDGATRNAPRGDYSAMATYAVGDIVIWTVAMGGDGSARIRIGAGTTTGTAPSDGTKWALYIPAGSGPAGADGVDGTDGVDGIDGKLIEFVWRRAASAPATPTGNGIPSGWSDDPPAGTDPLWMSKAKQELDGTLVAGESWSTPIRHDGPPGTNGTDGSPGPAGVTAVAVAPFQVAANSAGVIKAGALPQTRQMVMIQGAINVTASASWSVFGAPADLSISVNAAGLVTLSALTADVGSGTVRGTLGGADFDFPISARKVRDGSAALAVSVAPAFPTSGSMVVLGTTADLALPAGAAVNVDLNAAWEALSGTSAGTFLAQYSVDGGASWLSMGSNETASAIPFEPATLLLSRTLASSGSARLVRFRVQASMTNIANTTNASISNLTAGAA